MKLHFLVLYVFLFALFSSFEPTQACEYAGSNVEYVENEIQSARAENDLQVVRYHIYKALGAISKSGDKLEKCDCELASKNVTEVKELLKYATKASSVAGAAILLEKALQLTAEALVALKEHGQHQRAYGTDRLSMNTTAEKKDRLPLPPSEKMLEQKIDSALIAYRTSMDKVINSVNCLEARAFANRIYEKCEQELLRTDLSEGKKYYNLRTKQITAEALEGLGDCRRN